MSRIALLVAASLVLSLTAACSAETADAPAAGGAGDPAPVAAESEQNATGRVGSHGMVVAGKPSAAFLSHIPMFGNPMHDVQLIVRGSFSVRAFGPSLPSSLSDTGYTFLPERMSLDALRSGKLRELTGTLFLGNFEAGGRPIAQNVKFTVTGVVHEHVLDARARKTRDDEVIEFGEGAERFTAHLIGGAPSFDEIKATGTDGGAGKVLSCLEGPDFTRSCATDPK